MDTGLAILRLARMTAADSDPRIEQDSLEMLLDAFRTVDRNGVDFTQTAWIPTYALNAAASEGWLWKAGEAANRYKATDGVVEMNRQMVHTHCAAMASLYRKKAGSTLAVSLRAQGGLVVDRTASSTPWWMSLESMGNA